MDREEAATLLRREMDRYARMSHAELARLIGETEAREVEGESKVAYQIEIEAFWDHEPQGAIRVLGSIDDGGFRSSFSPLCDDLLVQPDDAPA